MAKYILEQIKIEGELQTLLTKTDTDNVAVRYKDADTTLTAALAGILADLAARPTDSDLSSAISTAIDGLIGGAPETYDTLKEIADYITSHEEVVEALNSAIGNKLDKSIFDTFKGTVAKLGALAGKDKVTENDLDAGLAEKVNAASEGNHSHANKDVLDGITSAKVQEWDGAAAAQHSHANQTELDKIAVGDKAKWDGIRGVRSGVSVPEDLKDGELFVKIIQS